MTIGRGARKMKNTQAPLLDVQHPSPFVILNYVNSWRFLTMRGREKFHSKDREQRSSTGSNG
jgi:hypothetical protein